MTVFARTVPRWIFTVCVLLGLTFGATACGESQATSAKRLDVKDPRLVTVQQTGDRSFSATLVNDNSRDVKIAQVTVSLYGAGGERVGTANIEVQNVPAKGEKQFKSPLDVDAEVTSARVRSITVP